MRANTPAYRIVNAAISIIATIGVALLLTAAGSPAHAAETAATAGNAESPVHAEHRAAAAELRAQFEADVNSLGLSPTQRQDIGELVRLYADQLGRIARRGEAARAELLALSPLDPDYDTLTNQVSQGAAAAAAAAVNTLSELQRQAFLLLSNEQQDRFLELRARRRAEARARLAEMRERREAGRGLPGALP